MQEVKREVPKGQAQSGPSSRPKNKVVPVAVKEIKVGQPKATTSAIPAPRTKDIADRPHATVTPKAVVQAKQTQTTSAVVVPSKSYHIIVASVGTEKDAELMAKDLVKKGFAGAKAIIGDGKMRVSIESCNTEIEAYKALAKIRQNEAYQSAWVLKK